MFWDVFLCCCSMFFLCLFYSRRQSQGFHLINILLFFSLHLVRPHKPNTLKQQQCSHLPRSRTTSCCLSALKNVTQAMYRHALHWIIEIYKIRLEIIRFTVNIEQCVDLGLLGFITLQPFQSTPMILSSWNYGPISSSRYVCRKQNKLGRKLGLKSNRIFSTLLRFFFSNWNFIQI